MDLLIKSQDALLLIIIPLMLVTAKQVKDNWASIWDNNLTSQDRRILLQASLFLLEPIVVLCHELGHAFAIRVFGGTIAEFHYAVLSGYVVPSGEFSDQQILLIYIAGNLVQIGIGYLCLVGAYFSRTPAAVATLVYLSLWSIASSAILYAMMSVIGLYGDWIAIYTSSEHGTVAVIAVCHFCVIASVIYLLKGKKPRLWFVKKTRPAWAIRHHQAESAIEENPSYSTWLHLAWLYYEASLNDFAQDALEECLELEPHNPEPLMLNGWMAHDKLELDKAESIFMQIVKEGGASPILQARAYMAVANCQLTRAFSRNATSASDPQVAKREAIEALKAASEADPNLADPHYQQAVLLNELQLYREAVQQLQALAGLKWLDPSLMRHVPEQMQIAIKNQTEEQ